MSDQDFTQPLLSLRPEPNHQIKDVLPIAKFIDLLEEEEDYYPGEQHKTKLMITRLRKIFYDQWGWNKELIEGAKDVETRYVVKIVDDKEPGSKPVDRYHGFVYQPKHRVTTYRDDDRIFGSTKAGQTPDILKNDHQEVALEDGYLCDVAHILAGLDAENHPQVVTPLPRFIRFLKHFFPHVDSNKDIVTWLGDIASSCGNFLFNFLANKKEPNSKRREQYEVNKGAPGSDMLGNIDSFVIAHLYDVGADEGLRFTDILKDYYFGSDKHHEKRFTTFCHIVGLQNWDGEKFSNERIWLKYYEKHLRNNTCFQVFSLTDQKITSVILPLKIYLGWYRKTLKIEDSLKILLKELKQQVSREQSENTER